MTEKLQTQSLCLKPRFFEQFQFKFTRHGDAEVLKFEEQNTCGCSRLTGDQETVSSYTCLGKKPKHCMRFFNFLNLPTLTTFQILNRSQNVSSCPEFISH